MRKVEGTIVERAEKYFVRVGREMHELSSNPFGTTEALKANVGQTVEVFMAEPQIVAIQTHKVPTACYSACFICYKPIDFFVNLLIDPRIRAVNLKAFLDEGLISQEIYDQQMKVR